MNPVEKFNSIQVYPTEVFPLGCTNNEITGEAYDSRFIKIDGISSLNIFETRESNGVSDIIASQPFS